MSMFSSLKRKISNMRVRLFGVTGRHVLLRLRVFFSSGDTSRWSQFKTLLLMMMALSILYWAILEVSFHLLSASTTEQHISTTNEL
jgi:hypothetical protein